MDEDLDMAVMVFRLVSFLCWVIFMTIGICMCCRARNQDFKERAEIKKALKKMSEKIRSLQSNGGEMMGLNNGSPFMQGIPVVTNQVQGYH